MLAHRAAPFLLIACSIAPACLAQGSYSGDDEPLDAQADPPPPAPSAHLNEARDAASEEIDLGEANAGAIAPPEVEIVALPIPNQGWIGGACAGPADCDFDDALCLPESEGFSGGSCSRACERLCPDRDGANSVTFCARVGERGLCMPRCDYTLFPQSGCRADYRCRVIARASDPSVRIATCLPSALAPPPPPDGCAEALDEVGIAWGPWNHTPEHPRDLPSLTCAVEIPVLVGPTIGGATYVGRGRAPRPLKASCDLAAALWRMSEVLAEFDLVEAIHLGTYNCRQIRSTSRLSEHGRARAIDVYGFIDSRGEEYLLERHWQHGTISPSTHKARVLYRLAQRLKEERIFRTILTPDFNDAHDNHFHFDTKPRGEVLYRLTDPSAPQETDLDPIGVDDPCGATP